MEGRPLGRATDLRSLTEPADGALHNPDQKTQDADAEGQADPDRGDGHQRVEHGGRVAHDRVDVDVKATHLYHPLSIVRARRAVPLRFFHTDAVTAPDQERKHGPHSGPDAAHERNGEPRTGITQHWGPPQVQS